MTKIIKCIKANRKLLNKQNKKDYYKLEYYLHLKGKEN